MAESCRCHTHTTCLLLDCQDVHIYAALMIHVNVLPPMEMQLKLMEFGPEQSIGSLLTTALTARPHQPIWQAYVPKMNAKSLGALLRTCEVMVLLHDCFCASMSTCQAAVPCNLILRTQAFGSRKHVDLRGKAMMCSCKQKCTAPWQRVCARAQPTCNTSLSRVFLNPLFRVRAIIYIETAVQHKT